MGRNNAQIDEDHFGSDGYTDSGEAGVQQRQKIMMKGRGFPEQKVNHKFRGGLLGIKHFRVSTANQQLVLLEENSLYCSRLQLLVLNQSVNTTRITAVGEKVNAAESLLVVSTEVNAN
ncbi:hypothetical protein Tco_1550375 [Tanacetum coccineum]